MTHKEGQRRQRISEGLKRHYRNLKRYEAIKKKRRAAIKGQETKFKKRMLGCVVVFDGQEYAFSLSVEHNRSALLIQEKLNLFPNKKYVIKLQVWLGMRYDVRQPATVISGSGDSEFTELIFQSHVTRDEFWKNYYARLRLYLDEQAPKGTVKYESADFQIREIQVC